jgi:hypothetical protein
MILAIAPGMKARAPQSRAVPACRADPVLTRLFAPAHPQIGRYEVCATPRPLPLVAPDGWTIDAVSPLDAFAGIDRVGGLDRAALARLYGGRPAHVARGWIDERAHFESVTLVSPYPDASLTTLEPGTLIVRFVLDGARLR